MLTSYMKEELLSIYTTLLTSVWTGNTLNNLLWLAILVITERILRKGELMGETRRVLSAVAIAVMTATSFDNAWAKGLDSSSKIEAAQIVLAEAQAAGVPGELALAIARIESHFTCGAKGKEYAMGVMQIKPATARSMGFKGKNTELLDCQTGAHYAVKYLKAALEAAEGDRCLAVAYYRAGIQERRLSKKHCAMAEGVMEQIGGDIVASAIDADIVKPKKKK
jgi:soluble lytic murein transglycosylase-like protein